MSYSKEDIISYGKEEMWSSSAFNSRPYFRSAQERGHHRISIEKAVNDQIMFDGSSIEGFAASTSRISTLPRPGLFAIFPWPAHAPATQVASSSVTSMTGRKPFVGDPGTSQAGSERAEEMG